MKIIITLALIFVNTLVFSQLPETDIFLCTIKKSNDKYIFSNPQNITNRPGYDNQPCFTSDNKQLLYVSVVDTLQSDVYVYDLKEKISIQFTDTKESEYSPSYTPSGNAISIVRVDADSGQRFYKIPLNNLKHAVEIKNTDSIGYACWLNDSSLAMFILGPSHSLQILNTITGKRKLIASDIGRCMKMSPDKQKIYFVLKSNENEWFIYTLNVSDFTMLRFAATIKGNEDFAVLPDGSLIMGKEGKLFQYISGEWTMLADFTSELKDFYRLAISNDGIYLALVAFTGKKP